MNVFTGIIPDCTVVVGFLLLEQLGLVGLLIVHHCKIVSSSVQISELDYLSATCKYLLVYYKLSKEKKCSQSNTTYALSIQNTTDHKNINFQNDHGFSKLAISPFMGIVGRSGV